ncbi:unnamed protein product [Closterium sp. Naga37s-1]|nr:unnamed protein product [Closterium sp. Naga37s-1]
MSYFHALRNRLHRSHSKDSSLSCCGKRAIQNIVFRGPVFAVLLALWLLSGVAFAAWLCYSTHATYLGDRYRRLDTWCYERAKLFEQHTLTTVSQIRTLAGLVSVMGKPRGHGNWTWDRCLTEQRWAAYLNNTSYSRPGNTGAMVCLFVTDAERPAFERFYGGPILDFSMSPRQQQPLYCPRLLEVHSYWKPHLLVDLMQRGGDELAFLRRTGDNIFTRVMPVGNVSLNLTGFTIGFPILQHALPPNPTEQQAEEAVLGAAGANVDVVMIARNVLQNVFAPDPSITFEVYDTTDPQGLTMIYGPGPRLVYYREHDMLPITDISPPNVTRPWEERSVVPLDLLGGRLRRYQVWCRYVEAPSAWLSWCVPFLWAALALVVTALIAAVAWQQRVGYVRSEESMAAADQLRAKARAAERSKSSFVASMSHELRTPMLGIVGLLSRGPPPLCRPAAGRAWIRLTVSLSSYVVDCVAGMVDTGVPAVLHMDTMRLAQALKELIVPPCPPFPPFPPRPPHTIHSPHSTHSTHFTHPSHSTNHYRVSTFLSIDAYAPPHPSPPPPPPRRPWFVSWLAYLHLQLGRLFSAATATCWGEQEPPDEGDDGDEDSSQLAMLGEEEQEGEASGEGEGDGEGDDARWSSGGEEMQLVLSCADTGCGFNSTGEELSEFKGRSESGGAGLGLVLGHQLVALMGGRVACLSHPGTGSTVAFSVPLARTRCSPPPASPAPPTTAPAAATTPAAEAFGREEGGTEERGVRSAGKGWRCGLWLGGKGGRGSRFMRWSCLQLLDARQAGSAMQGRRENEPCRAEAGGHAGCTRGVGGVAVGVVGPEGSTREKRLKPLVTPLLLRLFPLLTALMLAGLGAHVHLLPRPLDCPHAADARVAEGGSSNAEGSCEDAARAQGEAEEMRDGACRESGLCGQTDGGIREDGGEGGGAGERRDGEEGREGMPCVVVVNEEDLWWQRGGRAAADMRWVRDSEAATKQEDSQCRRTGQQGGQEGGGRGAGVVALAPGEAAAWQAAAVGLVRRCMAAHRGGGRAALGGGRWVDGEETNEEGVGGGDGWAGRGRGVSPTAERQPCWDRVAGIVILAAYTAGSRRDEEEGGGEGEWENRGNGGDEGDEVEERKTAGGGEEEDEACNDEGGAGSIGRPGQASPGRCTAPLASSLPGTASGSATSATAAPRVVVCCRPLLSHRLHHAVQIAAFGVGSNNAWHGSTGCKWQDSPEPARQSQQGRPQESGKERSEQPSSGRHWNEEKGNGPQQGGSSRDETGVDAGCGEARQGGSVRGEMRGCGFENMSARTVVVRSVSEHGASLAGAQPSSCMASRRAGAAGALEAAAGAPGGGAGAAGGVVAGWRVLVVDDTAVNLLVARRTLTRCGATVSTAGSGEEAVRRVAAAVSAASDGAASDGSAELDVVLMDLQMPAMDGFMTTEAIRELEKAAGHTPSSREEGTDGGAETGSQGGAPSHPLPPVTTLTRVPILALTADVDAHITRRCLASGFDGILQKPIDPKQLANLMLRIEMPPRLGPLRAISHPTTLSSFAAPTFGSH